MAKKNDNYVDLKTQPIPEGQHLLEVDDLKMYFHKPKSTVPVSRNCKSGSISLPFRPLPLPRKTRTR